MSRLTRVVDGWYEYQRLREKVAQLTSIAEKITPQLSDMPHASSSKSKDETWAALIDYKNKCQNALAQYYKDCKDLDEELNVIQNPEIRIAMKYKYIDRQSAEKIARKINFDVRTVYRFLKTGRRIYEDVYGK